MRTEDDRIAGLERDQSFVNRRGSGVRGGKDCGDNAYGLADFDDAVFRMLAQYADRSHAAHPLREQIGREHVFRELIGGVAVAGFLNGEFGEALGVIAGGGGAGFDDRIDLRLREAAIDGPGRIGLLDFGADLLNRYEVGIGDHYFTQVRCAGALLLGAGQNFFDVAMRRWDHVDGDEFAYTAGGGGSGIGGGFYGAHVATNGDGDESGPDVFLAGQDDFGGFHHCVGGFDRTDESLGFNHSERFHVSTPSENF